MRAVWVRGILVVVSLLVVAGCCKKSDESSAEPPATAAPSGAPAASSVARATEPELSDDDIAVAEDFVEEATKEVTEANYKSKLDELEKEIGATTD